MVKNKDLFVWFGKASILLQLRRRRGGEVKAVVFEQYVEVTRHSDKVEIV